MDTCMNIGYSSCLDPLLKEMKEIILATLKKSLTIFKDLNHKQYGYNLCKERINCPFTLYKEVFGACNLCQLPNRPRCTKKETNFTVSETDMVRIFGCDACDIRMIKGMNKVHLKLPFYVFYDVKNHKILIWEDISVVDVNDKKGREKQDYIPSVMKIFNKREEKKNATAEKKKAQQEAGTGSKPRTSQRYKALTAEDGARL